MTPEERAREILGPARSQYLLKRVVQALKAERNEALEMACVIVFGECDSDNVAQRTVNAIRKLIL